MEKRLLLFIANTNNFYSIVYTAEERLQKFHFCGLPFAVTVMLKPSIDSLLTVSSV